MNLIEEQQQLDAFPDNYYPPASLIPDLIHEITQFCRNTPHYIRFEYYNSLGALKSPPYRWFETEAMIQLSEPNPSSYVDEALEYAVDHVVYAHLDALKDAQDHWIDSVVQSLCTIWCPDQISSPRAIPSGIIQYLNDRISNDAVVLLLQKYNHNLWSSIPITLSDGPSIPVLRNHAHATEVVTVENIFKALWRVLSLWPTYYVMRYVSPPQPLFAVCEAALAAFPLAPTSVAFSVASMIKALIVSQLPVDTASDHWLLPTESAVILTQGMTASLVQSHSRARTMEAKIVLIAEFLEGCSADFSPHKTEETLHSIIKMCGADPIYRGTVHENHQIRLARSMVRVSDYPGAEALVAVTGTAIFDIYADKSLVQGVMSLPPDRYAWLDNEPARSHITDALKRVIGTICEGDPASNLVLKRMRGIIQGLEFLHRVSLDPFVIPPQ
ncbi:hypothetical protein C8R45DRAFT_947274 [Mycena sanguinolenta]|nr:hypothetical protein C8R45DRAFT_947274 [Mycena sanguinolenta]